MSQLKDLTGQRFGRLTVVERAENKSERTAWLCKCDCSNKVIVPSVYLTTGKTKSCGCYRRDFKLNNLTGERFGMLTVLSLKNTDGGHGAKWLCQCDCGNKVVVRSDGLTTGHTTSCGCYRDSGVPKIRHGMTNTRLHREWNAMKQRCNNPNFKQFKDYGGRGIKVCDEWNGKHGFDNFLKWAKENGQRDDLEIDRIDNDGNYEPSNCRWVTHKENMNNRGQRDYVKA